MLIWSGDPSTPFSVKTFVGVLKAVHVSCVGAVVVVVLAGRDVVVVGATVVLLVLATNVPGQVKRPSLQTIEPVAPEWVGVEQLAEAAEAPEPT